MKKQRFIALICTLVLSLLLTACLPQPSEQQTTPDGTTPEVTTPEVTTPDATTPEITPPEDQPDPDKPEDGVLVESIGGKNAGELLEQFAQDFENAESFYWDGAMSTTRDGITTQQFLSLKIYNGELALRLEEDGAFNGVYFVDGILYMNTDGVKIKMPANSVEEVLGEGAIDSLLAEMDVSFSQAEIEAAANANIYFENTKNKYLVTIHTTNEESGLAEETKLYFSAEGKLTDVHSTSDEGYAMLSIHSYNEPVEIDPPADADEFTLPGMLEVEIPEGAVPVDDLNGMGALELLEKYLNEFANATTLDVEILVKEIAAGVEITVAEVLKIGENSLYVYAEIMGEATEMWFIGTDAYIRMGEYKVKEENISYEDILGEGFWKEMTESLMREMPELYYAMVAECQLYQLGEEYFFSLGLSIPDEGFQSYFETVYFDKDGKVTRTEASFTDAEGNTCYISGVYNSYGEPVEVLPPEDADEYIVEGQAPELPEDEDEIYQLYVDTCTALQSATHYMLSLFIDGEGMAEYDIAGGDKYITVVSNGTSISQWLINNVGYTSVNFQIPTQTEITDAFLETFARFEAMFPIDVLAKAEIQNLRCSYNADYDEIVIEFEYSDEAGILTQYTYAIPRSGGYVDITITEIIDGTEESSYNFFFEDVPDLEITLP